jgi:hypothetical protein
MLPKENVPGSPHGYAAGHPFPVWVIFDAPQAYGTGLVYLNDRRCGAHSDTSELCHFRTFLDTNVAIAFKSQSRQLGTDIHRQRFRYGRRPHHRVNERATRNLNVKASWTVVARPLLAYV